MGRRRAVGALMGVVRVPPGCSRSASSMRRASKAHAAKVAVVATCRADLASTHNRQEAGKWLAYVSGRDMLCGQLQKQLHCSIMRLYPSQSALIC